MEPAEALEMKGTWASVRVSITAMLTPLVVPPTMTGAPASICRLTISTPSFGSDWSSSIVASSRCSLPSGPSMPPAALTCSITICAVSRSGTPSEEPGPVMEKKMPIL